MCEASWGPVRHCPPAALRLVVQGVTTHRQSPRTFHLPKSSENTSFNSYTATERGDSLQVMELGEMRSPRQAVCSSLALSLTTDDNHHRAWGPAGRGPGPILLSLPLCPRAGVLGEGVCDAYVRVMSSAGKSGKFLTQAACAPSRASEPTGNHSLKQRAEPGNLRVPNSNLKGGRGPQEKGRPAPESSLWARLRGRACAHGLTRKLPPLACWQTDRQRQKTWIRVLAGPSARSTTLWRSDSLCGCFLVCKTSALPRNSGLGSIRVPAPSRGCEAPRLRASHSKFIRPLGRGRDLRRRGWGRSLVYLKARSTVPGTVVNAVRVLSHLRQRVKLRHRDVQEAVQGHTAKQ